MNKEEMRQKLGNITQIRELLFGEQIEEYERKFTQVQQQTQDLESSLEALSLNLERFKSDTEEHLSQLKSSLSEEIKSAMDSLEKKIKYLSVNTYTEVTKINKEIDNKTQNNFQKIELISDRIHTHIKSLKDEANHNQKVLTEDIENLKKQLSETIEKNLSDLTEAKVSRHDFAEMLFELCLKIKGQDEKSTAIETNFHNGNQNGVNSDLLLLEEQTNQ
jgi:gas vesicle protein